MSEKLKSNDSVSHERLMKGYLKPELFRHVPTLIEKTGYSKSEIINMGVRAIMEKENIIPVKTAK